MHKGPGIPTRVSELTQGRGELRDRPQHTRTRTGTAPPGEPQLPFCASRSR